jgi:hypothetical protein
LLEAMLARRSHRFGKGMRLNGGPLAYESAHKPVPLSLAEEAAVWFSLLMTGRVSPPRNRANKQHRVMSL